MILKTKGRVLNNKEQIPKNAKCYGKRAGGDIGWCNPGPFAGHRWNKHSIDSPSIILVQR